MFFVELPKPEATIKEWQEWSKADELAYKKHIKRDRLVGEVPYLSQNVSMRKVNGAWCQSASFGFVGPSNSVTIEPAVEADQEKIIDNANKEIKSRGTVHRLSGAQKRKARKMRRRG